MTLDTVYKCAACQDFFTQFTCALKRGGDECDCPDCQGLCTCVEYCPECGRRDTVPATYGREGECDIYYRYCQDCGCEYDHT